MRLHSTEPVGLPWSQLTYLPSPVLEVRDQVDRYERSDGVDGGTFEGRPVVILTTIGRRSQQLRKNPIMKMHIGDRYLAAAAAAGATDDPSWFRNLLVDPHVLIQDGRMVRQLAARVVPKDERDIWWAVAESFWAHFPDFRLKAGARQIPLVLFEPPALDVADG